MTRPRLLPFTIAGIGLVLSLRLADIARDASTAAFPAGALVGVAAAATEPAKAEHAPAAPAATPVATPVATPGPPAAADAAPDALAVAAPSDPVAEAERKVLLELRQRRHEIDGHEQALSTREGMLGAAEKRLSMRVEELQALQGRLEQLEVARRAREAANWQGLVATYEKMKPRDAAPIFNDMDLAVLLPILDRMKDSKASAMLAAMNPDRARLVTQKLAETRLAANDPAAATGAAAGAPAGKP